MSTKENNPELGYLIRMDNDRFVGLIIGKEFLDRYWKIWWFRFQGKNDISSGIYGYKELSRDIKKDRKKSRDTEKKK